MFPLETLFLVTATHGYFALVMLHARKVNQCASQRSHVWQQKFCKSLSAMRFFAVVHSKTVFSMFFMSSICHYAHNFAQQNIFVRLCFAFINPFFCSLSASAFLEFVRFMSPEPDEDYYKTNEELFPQVNQKLDEDLLDLPIPSKISRFERCKERFLVQTTITATIT